MYIYLYKFIYLYSFLFEYWTFIKLEKFRHRLKLEFILFIYFFFQNEIKGKA